jgi:integrase
MAIEFLTDKRVQGLHAAEGERLEVRDEKVRGLVLRVTENGVKTFSVQYRVRGSRRTKRQTIGTYPAWSISDARIKALEIIRDVEAGRDPIVEDRAAKTEARRRALTFADLLGEYLERREGWQSMAEVERELRKDALPQIGRRQPAEITAGDVDAVAQVILKRGSPVMARRMVDHLKAMFNFLIFDAPELAERYGIERNPAERLGRRRRGSVSILRSRARQRVLADEEIVAWWAALDASAMPAPNRLAMRLVLVTGQRPGEVRCCRAGRLRLKGPQPIWELLEAETKSRRRHVVPLSPLAVGLFRQALELAAGEEFVFENPRRPGEPIEDVVLPSSQATLFRNHLADYEPATVHDLRRTAATGMRRIGVPPHIVSRILNHAPQDVTALHYDHYEALPERRDALERWAAHITSLVDPRSEAERDAGVPDSLMPMLACANDR